MALKNSSIVLINLQSSAEPIKIKILAPVRIGSVHRSIIWPKEHPEGNLFVNFRFWWRRLELCIQSCFNLFMASNWSSSIEAFQINFTLGRGAIAQTSKPNAKIGGISALFCLLQVSVATFWTTSKNQKKLLLSYSFLWHQNEGP